MDEILGAICHFGFQFAPVGWMQCNGQLLSIAQNTPLFALLGTTYGGDGQTTFGIPNLQGRSIVHPGQGPGLTPIDQGEIGGYETMTLLPLNMPMHTHAISDVKAQTVVPVTTGSPINETDGNTLGFGSGGTFPNMYSESTPDPTNYVGGVTTTISGTLSIAGGSQPFGIRSPYLAVNTCICTEGYFPSRN